MRLLIDECLPRKVKFLFAEAGHECETAAEAGFSGKENGELLALAENTFDVLVTIDKQIRYQQNMKAGISPS
jgi:predicted nuclease of predicted toxin-antitoxin system